MGDTNAMPPSDATPSDATDMGDTNAATSPSGAVPSDATDAGHMNAAAAEALGGRIHGAGQDRCAANRRCSGDHGDHLAPH